MPPKKRSRPITNVSIEDYVFMSKSAYSRTNWKSMHVPKNFDILKNYSDDKCTVFTDNNHHVVVSVRGTDVTSMDDIKEDGRIVAGSSMESPRTQHVMAIAQRLRADYPDSKLTLTGHSLGGRIAANVAVKLDVLAVTFNQGTTPLASNYANIDNNHINVIHFTTAADLTSVSSLFNTNKHEKYIVVQPKKVSGNAITGNHSIDEFTNVNWDSKVFGLTRSSRELYDNSMTAYTESDDYTQYVTQRSKQDVVDDIKQTLTATYVIIKSLRKFPRALHNFRERMDGFIREARQILSNPRAELSDRVSRAVRDRIEGYRNDLQEAIDEVQNIPRDGRAIVDNIRNEFANNEQQPEQPEQPEEDGYASPPDEFDPDEAYFTPDEYVPEDNAEMPDEIYPNDDEVIQNMINDMQNLEEALPGAAGMSTTRAMAWVQENASLLKMLNTGLQAAGAALYVYNMVTGKQDLNTQSQTLDKLKTVLQSLPKNSEEYMRLKTTLDTLNQHYEYSKGDYYQQAVLGGIATAGGLAAAGAGATGAAAVTAGVVGAVSMGIGAVSFGTSLIIAMADSIQSHNQRLKQEEAYWKWHTEQFKTWKKDASTLDLKSVLVKNLVSNLIGVGADYVDTKTYGTEHLKLLDGVLSRIEKEEFGNDVTDDILAKELGLKKLGDGQLTLDDIQTWMRRRALVKKYESNSEDSNMANSRLQKLKQRQSELKDILRGFNTTQWDQPDYVFSIGDGVSPEQQRRMDLYDKYYDEQQKVNAEINDLTYVTGKVNNTSHHDEAGNTDQHVHDHHEDDNASDRNRQHTDHSGHRGDGRYPDRGTSTNTGVDTPKVEPNSDDSTDKNVHLNDPDHPIHSAPYPHLQHGSVSSQPYHNIGFNQSVVNKHPRSVMRPDVKWGLYTVKNQSPMAIASKIEFHQYLNKVSNLE